MPDVPQVRLEPVLRRVELAPHRLKYTVISESKIV